MTQTLSPTSFKTNPLLDPVTYAPLPGSPCLGAASDGQAIGAVQPEPASVDQAEYDRALRELGNTIDLLNIARASLAEATVEYDRLAAERDSALRELVTAIAEKVGYKAERDAGLAEITRLRDALTRVGAEVVTALEGVQP
jgi:hypothetical protein